MKFRSFISAVVVISGVLIMTAKVQAETKRACTRSANTAHTRCAMDCANEHGDALLLCTALGNPPLQDCLQACSTDKESCLQPFQDTNRGCHDTCFSTFDAAMSACAQGDCQQGNNLQCQICRLNAKLERFQCARICTLTFNDTRDERQACRKTFRSCVRSCKSAHPAQ